MTLTIENIKLELTNAKKMKSTGVNYREQSFINYITNYLKMNVLTVENLGDKRSYKDELKIVASRDNETKYTFIGKYYDFDFFMPRENNLVLIEVSKGEKLYECEEIFYNCRLDSYKGKDHFILNTPIDELIDGVSRDKELEFVVHALKDKLNDKSEYEYSEQNKDDVSTFRIKLKNNDKKITIARGFQNTIQVDLEAKYSRMDSIQIHFRDKDTNEQKIHNKIESLGNLVDNYFNDTLMVDENNISTLINSLKGIVDRVNTDILFEGLKSLTKRDLENNDDQWVPVLYAFQIENENVQDDDEEYNQFEVHLGYSYKLKQFKLKLNYLFNEHDVTCNSVQEIVDTIEILQNLIKPQ